VSTETSERIFPMNSPTSMNRREAVRRIALLMGGAMVGSQFILSGQTVPGKTAPAFTEDDRALLDEIGDTIIPETSIPGAKATGIGAFMIMMVNDTYGEANHATFQAGLGKINDSSMAKFGKPFAACPAADRKVLANELYALDRAHRAKKTDDDSARYFGMMRDLTVLGYYSSEIGCTKAVRYIEVPGAYHGDVPYKKGDPAWF
jgi:hypothetical protein